MQVVTRALRVLSLVGEGRPNGISLTEIASELDLAVPTAHRIMKVLLSEQMVYRHPDSLHYFPGDQLLKIGRSRPSAGIAEVVGPQLRSLNERFNETVFATQLVGPRAVCVAIVESQRPLRISAEVGGVMPLHASAAARVLLAYLDESVVQAMLRDHDMKRFTANTPSTVEEVLARLARIKERGYEMSSDELDSNVWAVAFPIRVQGEVVASLTITAPVERSVSEGLRARMLEAVRDAVSVVQHSALGSI